MAQDDYRAGNRDTELILPPGVFAFVLDQTKGHINTLCGPIKQSLSNTDQLVTYDPTTKRFVPAAGQQIAIQTNISVPKGSYVILENPSNSNKQPEPGKAEVMPIGTLRMGQIENLPGPQSFPLWPGQVATVVKGHHLRSNQYLLVRVIDDEAAKQNWDKSVVKGATTESGEAPTANVLGINKDTLVTGQMLVIKGTAVAFYIPPTGIQVLTDESGNYVRDAVTLERLEYSILLDEGGYKEYKIGPAVVFPTPTQQFFVKDEKRKFRAHELQPTNGIHVKVIADYEEGGVQYKAGDELFVTGKDTPIYYPRPEHAVITYGGKEMTYAIAIPSGEGRYVLDRQTGSIDLVQGPAMFLPNPITQVVVRRVLSNTECELYYPGNDEVSMLNDELRAAKPENFYNSIPPTAGVKGGLEALEASGYGLDSTVRSFLSASEPRMAMRESAANAAFADSLSRGTKYTPPRMITLPTKYDGAVRIDVWSGFAVQVVNSKGNRRTVIGPSTVLLQYDEKLERLSLSKGKPKNSDTRIDTVYLRHNSNPVSDIIDLKTKDLVNVSVQVKYLVRFEEADRDRWFSVDNYVQYMVDHLRSIIGNAVRSLGVQEFYANATNILRDVVLGTKDADGRPLKHFTENGMTVYDLELIAITVRDANVANMLATAQQESLADAINLQKAQNKLATTKGIEAARRSTAEETAATEKLLSELEEARQKRAHAAELADIESENTALAERKKGEQQAAEISKMTQALYLDVKKAEDLRNAEVADADAKRKINLLVEEAKASETRMKAVQPALVEAIVALAQTGQLDAIAEHLAPLSIVRGESLAGTVEQLFKGTPLEGMVKNVENLSKVKTTR